jgi:hypothetical protein
MLILHEGHICACAYTICFSSKVGLPFIGHWPRIASLTSTSYLVQLSVETIVVVTKFTCKIISV